MLRLAGVTANVTVAICLMVLACMPSEAAGLRKLSGVLGAFLSRRRTLGSGEPLRNQRQQWHHFGGKGL